MATNVEARCPFSSPLLLKEGLNGEGLSSSGKLNGSSGPSGGAISVSTPGEPDAQAPSPPEGEQQQTRVPSRTVGMDPLGLFKVLLPLHSVLGLGVLLATVLGFLLPPWLLLLLSAALVLPPAVRTGLRSVGAMRNPDAEGVRLGGVTDQMEGEFCVFLLGARNNAPFKLDKDFGYVGNMFQEMVKELETLPESAGFLGADPYAGGNFERGSQVLAVTYWRSYEHMMKFIHDAASSHTSVLKQLGGKMSRMPHIGLWHEAYIIKPGQHESLYVNCPPFGLGAAAGVRPAVGPLSTSRGRMRASGAAQKPKDL